MIGSNKGQVTQKMRQIALDTETTGLEVSQGHRIIEIGAVEIVDRKITGRSWHSYVNPERNIDPNALAVHGLSREFLADKPLFSEIYPAMLAFIDRDELLIHNAQFDIGFIDHELKLVNGEQTSIAQICPVIDTLDLSRRLLPGKRRHSLDALCLHHDIDASRRDLHGALLDAELLAQVYLAMTSGQVALMLAESGTDHPAGAAKTVLSSATQIETLHLVTHCANEDELRAHQLMLERIAQTGNPGCLWQAMESS